MLRAYAGSATLGIYKTIDGGASWFSAATGLDTDSSLWIAIDPYDEEIVYAATFNNGVFKTLSGGE